MAFTVSDFRKNMIGDGARPALFEVKINPKSGIWSTDLSGLNFKCKATSLPASNIGSKTISYFGHDVHFAGDRTFDDWSITIYNDEDFKIRKAFEQWMDAIDMHSQPGAVRGNQFTTNPSDYTSDGYVLQYGKKGDVIKSYKFVELWPSSISDIGVDWDSKDDIEQFTVTFKYDYYESLTDTDSSSSITH